MTDLHDDPPTRPRKRVRDRFGRIIELRDDQVVPDGCIVTVPLFMKDAAPDPLKSELSRRLHDIEEIDLMARAGHAAELARLGRAEGVLASHSDAILLCQTITSLEGVARSASSPSISAEASALAERAREKLASVTGAPVPQSSSSGGEITEASVREAHEEMCARNRDAWRQPPPAPLASTSKARPQPQPEPQDDGTAEGAHAAMRARNRNAWREGR